MADALCYTRLFLAVAMPWLLQRGGWLPLAAWCVAALSDYVDGPLARRQGAVTLHGAVLDNVADITFVMMGLTSAVALGLVPWVLPVSIGLSAGMYAAASARGAAASGRALARSRLGHWAGVANYLCLGVVTAAVAWPGPRWDWVLGGAAVVTTGLNLAAVAGRIIASPSDRTA